MIVFLSKKAQINTQQQQYKKGARFQKWVTEEKVWIK